MVKNKVRDQFFLQQKSELATEADRQVVEDLLDTLRANQDFKPKHGKYNGFTAQIIQHEIDHFSGTLI